MLGPSNPQGLNRYTYAFNNPLRYKDPTGNWPPFDKITNFVNTIGTGVSNGLQVAQTKVIEMQQAGKKKIEEFQQFVIDLPGVDKIEYSNLGPWNTSMRVIDLKEGGNADSLVMHTLGNQNTIGISTYPIGILIHTGHSLQDLNHEAFHQWQQSTWKNGWADWYKEYVSEFKTLENKFGNYDKAEYYSSFEQQARIYAGQQIGYVFPTDSPNFAQIMYSDPRLLQMYQECLEGE
jgi:hypothetical protein